METGRPIGIWFSDEDRRRLEEAAALAGYKHLSAYVRDKVMGRGRCQQNGHADVETWLDREKVAAALAALGQEQRAAQVLMAMLLYLTRRKSTTGECSELIAACQHADTVSDILAAVSPDLATVAARLAEER